MNFRGGPGAVRRRAATVVDMTALVDVVFQLLIFFLLTSTYISQAGQTAPQVPVDLPEAPSLPSEEMQFDDLTVTIDSEGKVYLEEETPVSLEELAYRFARIRDSKPKTIVLLRGDQNVPYGRVAQVMELARVARLNISAVLGGGE